MTDDRAHVSRAVGPGVDLFERFPPPLGLTSDMILTAGVCPVDPLRDVFPSVPFASLAGRALLGIWFARVEEVRIAADRGGDRHASVERPGEVPYLELNVAVLLRDGHLFVPGIYATSDLSLRLGHRYGMPKRPIDMRYAADARGAASRTVLEGRVGSVRGRALTDGRGLATLLSWLLPAWTVPVAFPGGASIEARLEGVERARLVWLVQRRLALGERWLPRPVSLWPLALHVAGQRMTLPRTTPP